MSNPTAYQITPVKFTQAKLTDSFWAPRLETNRTVTIPYNFARCEETGRIENFSKAAGLMPGDHEGIFFNDSDVFKVVEGAAYSLTTQPDAELEAYVDALIEKIAAAQEADGYLYTARTIAERNGTPDRLTADREGLTRWSNLRVGHELYNVGHLYEAAVAYFQATGKRTLLDVAFRNADLVDQVFGPDKKRDVPGHEEIEIGLVKLAQVTGDDRYLQLAQFFVDERGQPNGRELQTNYDNPGYTQDHQPVVDQTEAVGHAVRAGYLYSGVADVAALTHNPDYIAAIDRIWQNVVGRKLYITGGIGALPKGEAFGADYELPNETAYAETCAAIANIFWNQRMFLLHGQARYIDVLERTLYNGFLSGVSFSGDRFFYVNPLASDGKSATDSDDSHARQPWFRTSCCPTNVARFLPSLPGYLYAQKTDRVYVNLFIAGQAELTLGDQPMQIRQETNYPWDGQVQLTFDLAKPTDFTLCLRMPGWAQNQPVPSDLYQYLQQSDESPTLTINGKPVALTIEQGFAQLKREWQSGDQVVLTLPMPIRRVSSHPAVAANVGRVALERGPLVYCFEGIDNDGSLQNLALPHTTPLAAEFKPDLLNGVTVITGPLANGRSIQAIPYYAWAHRGPGEMAVWLPIE